MEKKRNIKEKKLLKNGETEEYLYLREHPSILVSCVSAIVLIISFIFNALIYAQECKCLEYWHLDKELISISRPNQIYEFVTLSFLYLLLLLLQRLVMASFEKYYEETRLNIYERIIIKSINKKLCENKKEIIKKSKKIKKKMLGGELSKAVSEEKEVVNKLEKEVSALKKAMVGQWRRRRKQGIAMVVATLILTTILLVLGICFWGWLNGININFVEVIIAIAMVFVIMWIMPYTGVNIFNKVKESRCFKRLDNDARKEHYEQFMKMQDYKEKYPIERIVKFEYKKIMDRTKLGLYVIYAFLILVCLIGTISLEEKYEIEQKKEFAIVEEAGINYAIIYGNNSFLYLEEVRIEGTDIFIYVDKQRRIASEDIYFENRVFKNVTKIPDN